MSDKLMPSEEHLVDQLRQDRQEEGMHTREEGRPTMELGALPKHKGSPGQQKEGQAQMRRSGGAEKTPDREHWEGEVHGLMYEEPEALLKVFSTLEVMKRAILKGRPKDKIEDEVSWSDEEEDGDEEEVAEEGEVESDPADVEGLACTTTYANDLPLAEVQSALFDAVREKYPTRNTGTIPKISWDPKDTPGEFLAKAKEQWLMETGIHPGKEGESRAWFRSAVLAGLPKQVTADLEKNPDFAVADSVQWERHVVHRLQQEQDSVNKQKKELEEAQALLVKLQLGEARDKLNNKKKELKEPSKTVMVARPGADPVPDWPDLDPNLYPDDRWPANAPGQRRPAGNWGTGGSQRGRGGSGRSGLRARNSGFPRNNDGWNCCFTCGAEGHWSRNCPVVHNNYVRRGYQPQARGNIRGGAAYRGAHQAPNPSAAPVAQYPVADWGWDGEQY
ncbi:uncharacterized protein LOC112845727 [Oreochromis niloticus]|uniref:uncharacterized protein LOC112845727 n=1 Tax=Oreochromis niloticus TaxID=8128 RepID=UPI000DF4714F|nr:uncharacterized protein LOC112845727 [Oreochromis niloticus]